MMASKAWQHWLHYTVTRACAPQHGFSACRWLKVERLSVTPLVTSGHKQEDTGGKNNASPGVFSSNGWMVSLWSIMCHLFWLVLSFFHVVNVALSAPKGNKKQVNRETSQYVSWLHRCEHKPRVSWGDVCPLSRCFTPNPPGGLFVSCFRAWQLWHRFLPSWPCSLKCNKSWIPRLCCTSIRVLLVADKWSPTRRERGEKQAGSRNCCPVLLSESKVRSTGVISGLGLAQPPSYEIWSVSTLLAAGAAICLLS